jgi:hypothetical protein
MGGRRRGNLAAILYPSLRASRKDGQHLNTGLTGEQRRRGKLAPSLSGDALGSRHSSSQSTAVTRIHLYKI